jgi:phosphoribosylformylglycinamidine synthase
MRRARAAHPAVASKNFLITIGDRTVTGLTPATRWSARGRCRWPTAPSPPPASTSTPAKPWPWASAAGPARRPGVRPHGHGETITNLAAAHRKTLDIKLSANWMAAAGHPAKTRLYDTVKAVGMELCPGWASPFRWARTPVDATRGAKRATQKSVTSPMSLIVTGFAPVTDIRKTLTPQLRMDKGETDLILIDLGAAKPHGRLDPGAGHGKMASAAPDVDDAEDLKAFFAVIQGLNADGHLLAYHDRSDGGLLPPCWKWPSPATAAWT